MFCLWRYPYCCVALCKKKRQTLPSNFRVSKSVYVGGRETEEMVQRLRVPAALPEDWVFSTHMAVHKLTVVLVCGIWCPLLLSAGTSTLMVHRTADKAILHIKYICVSVCLCVTCMCGVVCCVCTPYMCRYPWKSKAGIVCHEPGAPECCELPVMCSGNRTQFLCKNRKCS